MNPVVRFDKTLIKSIQTLPIWIKPIMQISTFMGNITPIFAALSVAFFLASPSTRAAIIFIVVCIFLNAALKQFVHRPRPDTLYVSLMRFKTHSFPSGHAFGSITAYGFVSYLALINLSKSFGFTVAASLWILIALIGTSRVYLGAHYPTDVVGGWILGTACLSIAIAII